MNTVIPLSNDRIAGHFTKAESFLVLGPQGQKISTHTNPAFNNHDCATKKKILDLFKAEKIERVIVRNIGQRILGKLLNNQMQVFKSDVNYLDQEVLLNNEHSFLKALTKVEQGRPSLLHEAKDKDCGCHDDKEHSKAHSKKCCEQPDVSGHVKKPSKGRCCH